MSHTFHQLHYHVVWATKYRKVLIPEHRRKVVIDAVTREAKERGGIVHACNTMPDHVHLAFSFPPTKDPATYIGQIKGASAYYVNHGLGPDDKLAWQEGYGIVTYWGNQKSNVIAYVENQEAIHANRKASRLLETTGEEL